jgi:hypothetical protein
MATCSICGDELREGDAAVEIGGVAVHDACALAQPEADRRRPGRWAALGANGQLGLTDVQRETP